MDWPRMGILFSSNLRYPLSTLSLSFRTKASKRSRTCSTSGWRAGAMSEWEKPHERDLWGLKYCFFFLVPKWAPKSMCGITNIPQTSCTYEVRSAKIIMIDTMDWMGAPCITLYSNELFNCHVSMPLLPMWQRVPWILVSFGHSST